MADNIWKAMELIYFCKRESKEAIIMSLDFEKAFDSVEFKYINKLLVTMNFGNSFSNTMQAIYKHSVATVRANNLNSTKFGIHRGTRQGCPISPLLFALSIEPLANLI